MEKGRRVVLVQRRKKRLETKRKEGGEVGRHKGFGRSGGTSSLACASPLLCVSSSFSSLLF